MAQAHVQLKFPEPTELGLEFLQSKEDQTFNVYPEADMLLSVKKSQSFSSFSEWGKGWADPEIRRQRLERIQSRSKQPKPMGTRGQRRSGKLGKRKRRNHSPDMTTVRGRITAKMSKK